MAVLRRKGTTGGNGPTGPEGPSVGQMTMGEYANGMPNIRLAEFGKSFMRQLPWMIPLTLGLCALSFYFTKDIKRQWVAEGRILVQLGPEFVYNDALATQGSGQSITTDHVVLTESGIIKNADTLTRAIKKMQSGPLADEFLSGFDDPTDMALINKQVEESYSVIVRPKSSIIDVTYSHDNPEIAVKMLNELVGGYTDFRKELFIDGKSDNLQERRDSVADELARIESRIKYFHKKNDVADYTSERKGVRTRTEALRAELNTLRASMTEVESALAKKEAQLRSLSPTINLYVEDRAQQRVAQAELELKQLLARYLPGSQPIIAKEAEIAELKSLQSSNGGQAFGGRRVGPNPVYQAAETDRNQFQAQANALREKEYVLQQQLNAADSKVRKLQNLEPVFQDLIRERASLERSLTAADQTLNEALVNQAQQADTPENIKIFPMPQSARKGRNMQKILFALGCLASIFGVVMLALLKVFLDPRLYAQPGPGERRALGYEDNIEDEGSLIPEPVKPYEPPMETPSEQPLPAVAQAVPYEEQVYAQQTYAAAPVVNQNPYLQAYADNPYAAASASQPAVQETGLPVLGIAPVSQYG